MPYRLPLPDFESLIRACCGGADKSNFEAFRKEWQDYLQAAISPFIQDWAEGEIVIQESYAEYAGVLASPCSEKIRYEEYFLAIAFACLTRRRGSRPVGFLRQLLGKQVSDRYPEDHPLCILAFSIILTLPHPCFYELLDTCFKRPYHAFGLPLALQPKARKECSDQFGLAAGRL